MQFDDTDLALIAALRRNARTPVAELARSLGLARTTVQARIDRLLDSGAVQGFTLVPGAALSPPLRATVLLSLEPRATAEVLSRLKRIPQVEEVHTTSGRFDMIATLAADTTETLDRCLDEVGAAKGVRSSESLIHLSTKLSRRG